MTRDEILAIEPGRELDKLVAEHIFKWRKIPGPKTDYDGPCESFDVLVPPTIDDPFPYYPPRGEIKPWFFCHNWSTDMSCAWRIVDKMKKTHWLAIESDLDGLYYCSFTPFHTDDGEMSNFTGNVAEAICKAALLALEVTP